LEAEARLCFLQNLLALQLSQYGFVLCCGSFPLDETPEEIAIAIRQTFPQFSGILATSL
jgi:hypothetical protein